MNRKVRKIFIVVQILGTFLWATILGGKENVNINYTFNNLVIVDFVNVKGRKAFANKVEKLVYSYLHEFDRFEIAPQKNVKRYTRRLGLSRSNPITSKKIGRIYRKFKSDLILYATINKIEGEWKIFLKVVIAKSNQEFYSNIVTLGREFSNDKLKKKIKNELIRFVKNLPHAGYVTEVLSDGNVKLKLFGKAKQGSIVRIINIDEVSLHPLLGKIEEFKKTEIGVIEVTNPTADSVEGKIILPKEEMKIKEGSLVDFEISEIYKEHLAGGASGTEVSEDDKLAAMNTIEENIQAALDLGKGKNISSDVDGDFESEIFEESQASGENKNFTVYAEPDSDFKTFAWSMGIDSAFSFNSISLLSRQGDGKPESVSIKNRFSVGISTNVWLWEYLGFDISYTRGFVKYTVNYNNLDLQPRVLNIATNRIKVGMLGRYKLPFFTNPSIGVKCGYEDYRLIIEEYTGTQGSDTYFLFIPSITYRGITASPFMDFPFIKDRFGLRAGFTYWVLPFFNETPDILGASDGATIYSIKGGLYVRLVKGLFISANYERLSFSAKFTGSGSVFMREFQDTEIKDAYHNMFLTIGYNIF